MALRPLFNMNQVEGYIRDRAGLIKQAIINRLKFVGEKFIVNARSNDTYKDQTGNLRSSIGYVILDDGDQIEESFPGDKSEGVRQGKATAESAKENFPTGLVLIGIAGMGYAAAVESRGLDVITASSITAENDLKKALSELKSKLG